MAPKRRASDKPLKFSYAEAPPTSERYYFGDQLNPNLQTFAAQHLKTHPYNPQTDNYDPPVFQKPIKNNPKWGSYFVLIPNG